ncbi:hypothetical protein IB277_31075 [Ensifer sp. ENS07]|uniref:hypothetical protein n=1 Tax=Ensifer sp. ENS07 TaxID=2769274 RepID=UPI00177C1515|nr:hypothetical protein [Ensifer sp. ENS07]MBD9640742.1 hypothetical protein [Ensifer sp. ENS07]
MAVATLKVRIRLRWWVLPFLNVAFFPAALIAVCFGSQRAEAFGDVCSGIVARFGVIAEVA